MARRASLHRIAFRRAWTAAGRAGTPWTSPAEPTWSRWRPFPPPLRIRPRSSRATAPRCRCRRRFDRHTPEIRAPAPSVTPSPMTSSWVRTTEGITATCAPRRMSAVSTVFACTTEPRPIVAVSGSWRGDGRRGVTLERQPQPGNQSRDAAGPLPRRRRPRRMPPGAPRRPRRDRRSGRPGAGVPQRGIVIEETDQLPGGSFPVDRANQFHRLACEPSGADQQQGRWGHRSADAGVWTGVTVSPMGSRRTRAGRRVFCWRSLTRTHTEGGEPGQPAAERLRSCTR